jgi:CRP-like cAMP-binding protein
LIIQKGDEATEMFILYSGEVGVYIDDRHTTKCVAVLNENKVFGETALIKNDKRSATIKAHTVVKVMVLNKIYYRSIISVSFDSYHNNSCTGCETNTESNWYGISIDD